MYAIIEHGSHHYRISAGDRILVDRIKADVGATVTLERVLLVADGDGTVTTGGDGLSEARVTATVVAHRRGRKLRVLTYKPKKRHRRTLGYRSQLTELRVDEVAGGGSARPQRRPAAKAAATPAPAVEAPSAETGTAVAAEPAARATPRRAAARKASDAEAPAEEKPSPRPTTRRKPSAGTKSSGT